MALSVPVLLQILSGINTAQTLLPAVDVYVFPSNKVVETSIPSGIPGGPVRISIITSIVSSPGHIYSTRLC